MIASSASVGLLAWGASKAIVHLVVIALCLVAWGASAEISKLRKRLDSLEGR